MLLSIILLAAIGSVNCTSRTVISPAPQVKTANHAININAADIESMQRLPGIGPELARKIVEHRTRYGPFRKIEHILIVEGISEKRFEEARRLMTVD